MKWHEMKWEVILDIHQTFPKVVVIEVWTEGSRSRLLTVRCVADPPLSLPGPPSKAHQDGSKAAHEEDSPARGKVKTDVLSLFKTVTHENLPNLRHFAFPLATSSAWNHKCVGDMLGWLLGLVSVIGEMT